MKYTMNQHSVRSLFILLALVGLLLPASFNLYAQNRSAISVKKNMETSALRTARFSSDSSKPISMNTEALNKMLRQIILTKLNNTDLQKNEIKKQHVNALEPEALFDITLRNKTKKISVNQRNSNQQRPTGTLSVTSQLAVQASNTQSSHSFYFTGNEQPYVLRYICCSGLPIIDDPSLPSNQLFSDSNIVATPDANEVVAVFDDLPVYNGDQLFVRVQRSGGQHYWGWFPLFWLHEISSPKVGANIHTGVSYQGISKQIRDTVQNVFYKNCHVMHPEGGVATFPIPASTPADKNYECGEYPVGNTSYNYYVDGRSFRPLATATKVINSYSSPPPAAPFQHVAYGYRGAAYGGAIVLDIPFRIGNLETQTRRDNDFSGQELGDYDFQFLTRTYWQSDLAQQDENIRIHAMDWYFKTWFESDAQANTHEVNFSLRVNLPGFDIYNPRFNGDVLVWYRDHQASLSEAHIKQFAFGGMRIQDIPLRIDGKVVLNVNQAGDGGNTFVANTSNKVSVQFTDIRATTEPELSFYGDTELLYESQGNIEYINHAMNYFKTVLDGVISNDGFGSYFWEVASEKVLSSLMVSLQELEPRLVQLFDSPRSLAVDSCNAAIPSNYKTMQSPFYAFYRNCTDFAATINTQHFVNPSHSSIHIPHGFTENATYWANVNLAGLPWSHPGHDEIDLPCVYDASCTSVIERPWWSRYDPYYAYTGGSKFTPSSYSYVSSKGGKVRYKAYGEATKHYWHFLRCLIPSVDKKLNANPQHYLANSAALTPEECRLPALETVCELYGEGEDLESQWEARWGYVPPLSGYAQYCAWAEELRNEEDDDGFDLQIE